MAAPAGDLPRIGDLRVTTYRVGNHHGVTIVREDDGHTCARPDHDCERGHLVAVITNDNWELAERICALLNAYMPSACTRVGQHNCDGEWRNHDRYEAAAELGVGEDAPGSPRIQPQSDRNASGVGRDTLEAPRGSEIHCVAFDRDEDSVFGHCACGHSIHEHEGTLGPCIAELGEDR